MTLLRTWNNGNATINIHEDGTRVIDYPDTGLELEWPLNIDIRTSTKCTFGYDPGLGRATCDFCHEAARTDGVECDYEELLKVLDGLPAGIELAFGMNHGSSSFMEFLRECAHRGYICNVTVNQGHIQGMGPRTSTGYLAAVLNSLLTDGTVKGIGVSYRPGFKPAFLQYYPHSVVHVIAGINDFDDVLTLRDHGVKKVLVLGEKDFGLNIGRVKLMSPSHFAWKTRVMELFEAFEVVSFDNLALEQLNPKRFFSDDIWAPVYQGEHSFYINAVTKTFAPSSRSAKTEPYTDIRAYYKRVVNNGN